MKKTSGWIILFGILTVPAAIYYSIQLWGLWTNKAQLSAFVKREKIELPAVYRAYLRAVDSPEGRKRVGTTYDAAAKDNSYYHSDLEALRKFTESFPIFGWGTTEDVVTVKIVNAGRKVANDIKVF